jgi:hypothetical protein
MERDSDTGILKRAQALRTPIDPAFADLAAGGMRTLPAPQQSEDWFGPSVPIQPQAPPEAAARAYDFPVGYNLTIQPRAGYLPFELLRNLAESHDITRLCIETRKDQLVKLKTSIRGKEGADVAPDDKRVQEIEAFLRFPDRLHSWQAWLRMLMEDVFVIDAPAIYPRQNLNDKLYALEIVDGATIKLVIDGNGRTPVPPAPAYQQIIHGIPATEYTAEELVYVPRNPRSWRLYGYSPVEQTIMIVNIALRRQLFQLNFYMEGSIPEGFAECPQEWSAAQIGEFQGYWDALLSGNLAMRRRMIFVPSGAKPLFPKLEGLKDEFDEWLARVVCYCHSLPPTPFVRQMNRAVAQSVQQTALEEGLQPLMQWIKDLMDYIIWRYWGFYDLEFAWQEEESVAPDVQATIDASDVAAGIVTRREIRTKRGLDDDGIPNFIIIPGIGPVLLDDIGKEQPEPGGPDAASDQLPVASKDKDKEKGKGKEAEVASDQLPVASKDKDKEKGKGEEPEVASKDKSKKLDKAAKKKMKIEPIDRDRPPMAQARADIKKLFQKAFEADLPAAAASLAKGLGLKKVISDQWPVASKKGQGGEKSLITDHRLLKTDDDEKIDKLLADLDLAGIAATRKEVAAILAQAAQNGGLAAFVQLDFEDSAITSQVNKLAVEWAENRAAELVTKIEESTRDYLRADVTQAVQEGWSTARLSGVIQDNFGFSAGRCDMIARTEIAKADVQGNMMAYRASGLVSGKKWILGSEHPQDDECNGNADEGVIPLDQDFSSGDDAPPAHPNCECDVIPELGEKE